MKKTLSLVLCVAMIMSSLSFCFPAFALEMDFNVESAENYAPTTDDLIGETAEGVTLAATAKAGDPGINIWTGTTAAFDFQDMTSANVGLAIETDAQRANEKVRVGGKEIFKTESENNYIAFGGVSYPQFYPLTDGVSVDSARPVKVSFDYRAAGATNVILVRNRDNALNPALKTMSLPAASGWTSYNVTVKGIDAGEGLKGYAKSQTTHPGGFSDDTTNIKNIYFIYGGTAPAVDFDNLSARPYYKVSFYKPDGTTLISSVYVDPDETTYTVPSNGKYALKGTTTPVTTVTLANKDIELVATGELLKAGMPGVNVFTGTLDAYGFENPNYKHMYTDTRRHGIQADPADANNKVMWLGPDQFSNMSLTPTPLDETNKFYPIQFDVVPENDRPLTFSMDVKASKNNSIIYLYSGLDNSKTYNPNGWRTLKTWSGISTSNQNVNVKITYSDLCRYGFPLLCLANQHAASDDVSLYIDNLKLIPDYKVTFYAADGKTVLHSEYVAATETTYTVPAAVIAKLDTEMYSGFALKGTTDVVTSAVSLANEDLEFIAQLKPGAIEWKAGMPGVNVFTSDLNAYGFEDPNLTHLSRNSGHDVGIVTDPDNANNKVLKVGSGTYTNVSLTPVALGSTNAFEAIKFDITPEASRPFTLYLDVKSKNNAVMQVYSGLDNAQASNGKRWACLTTFRNLTATSQTVSLELTYQQMCQYDYPLLCLMNANDDETVVHYVDNMKLIPDYKVTFYAADGKTVLHSEYVDGAETTYTISADATNKLDTEIYGGFAAKGTTEIVTGSVALNNYDLEFVAQLKPGAVEWKAGMPGVNLWTGTPAAYDFESDDNTSFTAKFRPVGGTTLEAYTSGGVATNVVKMSGGYPHFTTRLGTTPVVDKDRPVLVSYDYITPVSTQIRIIRNVINKTDPTLNQATTAVSANWSTHKDTVVGNSKPVTNVPGAENYNDDTQDIKNFWFMKPNDATGHVVYLDNISLIPYYKVTYYDYDGTTAIKTEYVAPDAGSITLPALDANIYKGYALKGTTNVVTSAKLRYEDLEFVALLKDGVSVATPVSYTGNDNKTTGVDYRFPGVSYTFDEELDDTTLAGVSAIEDASGWELSGDKKTLTVYPFARNAVPGETLTFARTPITSVKTASGKNVIFTEATLKFADSVDAYNLIPAGNMEGAYLPISAIPSQVADIEVRAETEGDNSYAAVRYLGEAAKSNLYAYARTLVAFEEGASYKLYADVKILGGSPVAENIADVWSNMVYANADHAAKAVLTTETGWKEFTREFKTTGLVDSEEAIAFYSNPNGANVTEYAIDNLEVYKRAEVKFEESEFAPLKSGASNPVVEGKYPYIKGGAKNPDAKITLPTASDYYEATDARRTVSGWLGSDGVVYADGTVVDLAETFSITFQPNLVAAPGYKFITVKFEGDLAEAPAAVKSALEGDTVDLTNYYNVTASAQAIAAGKRFNGWSLTGEAKDIIDSFEIANALADSEDVITVKAVVNYDWNFAIPANHTGWKFDSGETKFENNMLVGKHINNGSHDTRFSNNNLAVPGGRVQSIIYVLDEDITYIDRKDHSAANITDMKIVATDNAIKYGVKDSNGSTFPLVETIYYGQGHARKATHTISTVKVSDLTDGFKAVTVTVYDTAAKKFVTSQPFDLTQKLTTADFDTNTTVNNAGLARLYSNVGLRYIHFADYPKYDTKTVAITDLETPETGKKPDTAATVAAGTVKTIKWSNLSASGNFKESTQYEVTVILEPEAGKRYADDTVFTLEGATATSTVINNDSTGEAVVTFKFNTATEAYKAFNFDLSTVTDIEVTSVDPIQLTANITEAEAGVDTRIVWSLVDGGNIAMITEDGLLTVSGAGTITVKAVSVYNENKAAEKTINITLANGMKTVQVSFAGDLATVPSAITKLSGSVISMTELYDATASTAAVAAGKRFNGWSTTGELKDLITTNTWTVPAEDATLTAIVNYDLNLAIPANTANVSHSRGTVTYDAEKGMVFADHTAGQTKGRATDFFVEFRAYAPMKDFKGFEAYLADEFIAYADNDKSSFTTKKFTEQTETPHFYFSNSGGYHFTNPTAVAVTGVDGVEYAKYVSIANSHEKWINGNKTTYMRLDPFDTIITSAYVRYLRYIPYDVYEGDLAVTFDAPVTGEAPIAASVNEIGVLKSFTVTPDVPAESGLYEGAKVYTATAVIEPADKSNYRFKDGVKVIVGGVEATDAVVAADGTVTVTITFPATDAYVDFDMTVECDALDGDTLVTDGTPVQFTAEFTGEEVTTEEVIWSVDNETVAVIDENGVLTPYGAGQVVVTAKSKYNLNVVRHRTVDVELEDGMSTVEISFAGDLAEVPATVTRISGLTIDLTEFYNVTASATAVADAKRFNGWSTTGELKDLITTNTWTVPEENTTLYAIVNHDVNFAIPANMAGLSLSRSNASYEDGVVFVEYIKGWSSSDPKANAADVYMQYPSAKVPMEMYRGMEFYFLDDYTTFGNNNKEGAQDKKLSSLTKGEAFYFSSTGGYHNVAPTISKVEGADGVDYAVFTAITNEHSNWIDGQRTNFVRLDPMTAYADFRIRYLRFVPYEVCEGDIEITADVPTTGVAVSDKTTVNEIGKVTEIAVDPDNFIKYTLNGKEFKNYVAGQAYKLVYTVKIADSAACFSDSVAATVNGYDAVVTLNASKTTAYVEYTFPATEAYTPIAVSITGPSEILTKGRGTQYRATITAPDGSAVVLPTTSVTWSVDPGDEGYATINAETGKLVPIRNAYTGLANESVTIVATSNYDGTTVATYDVQLKNQATEAIVNYNLMGGVPTAGGTALDPTVGAGSIKLAEASSVARAGYHFVGWATSDESAETVDILTLTVEDDQNTSTTDVIDYTVYAVWQKVAHGWEFNSQAEVDAFPVTNSESAYVKRYIESEGLIEFDIIRDKNSDGKPHDTYQYYGGLSIDSDKAKTLVMRIKTDRANTVFAYFPANSIDGDQENDPSKWATDSVRQVLTPDVWNEVVFDLTNNPRWHGTITKVRFDYVDNGHLSTTSIDYIRFLEDYATVTYDANAGSDTVTGLPESGLVKFGGKATPAEVPTRDGYIFTGWSKTADGSTAVKKEFGIVGDVTLYAIWEASNTTVEADGSIVVGAINPAADEVLLVKTDAGATVTLFGDDGAPLMTATAGSDGYAEFDLTTLSAPVTNATIATDAGNTLESATVTDAETADTITSVPKTEDTGAADDDDDDKPSSAPSTKVETVTKPGTIDPSTMYPEEEVEEEEGEKEFQFNGYPVVNTDELPYVDVNTGNWFYKEVESAYKLGFVKGKSVFTYDPNGNVTIAEAITFALRLNYGYNGKEMPEIAAEGDWYAPIVEAALEAGIIKKAQFTEYDVPALRKQVAAIMAKSVPSDYLGTKNMFTNIPDVNKKAPEFTAILKLYRAGVVMGSDDNYNFMPETNITRAEMSAIINRIAIPDNRKRIVTPEELEARRKSFTAEDIAKEATAGNCYSDKLSLKGGHATATGKSADPIIYLTNLVPELDGANTGVIRIGLKTDAKPAPQLFFTVPGGGWAADRMLSGTKGADKGNGVVEYVFDTKSNTQFANTITGLRFDPFNAKDIEFAIAYVIFE